ncbi:hypothetical protein [Nitrosopumilus sp.]|uniref:hypothetical protein n=1 Tax=Nitrosopumilus sp. TaxID=2024843 RepID=UPI003B593E69
MLAKSLIIFVGIGVFAGLGYGIFLMDVKNTSQLIYVEGSSLSIVTEKFDFKKGEDIQIRIINSGTTQVNFTDTSYGLRITGLSGILMYSPSSTPSVSILDPGEEVIFLWDQKKNDGDGALEGLYKISVKGTDPQGMSIEKSATVTIWK